VKAIANLVTMRVAPGRLALLGAFALALTIATSAAWSVLLASNLRASPRIPWSVPVMIGLLWIGWRYLGGASGSARRSASRRDRLRARPISPLTFGWALAAGLLSIGSLAGLWIVLHQLVHGRSNTLPDFSQYSLIVVVLVIGMGALSGAMSEEAGFRGYFQGALEPRFGAPLAIITTALLILPAHGLTQGFGVATIIFYLCVDTMLGAMAYITQSIVPGIAVHFVGLVIFFAVIWPHDATRRFVAADGPDGWFWLHASQAVIGAVLAVLAFRRLARIAAPLRPAPLSR
jgi:membrane protease YdiL (CAAX protease family)